ncbi:hypothetical protein BDR26DRAFT_858909 [Obelidium mucronatum]|nr:hypothetical protein BDR26DRAFT_858909 [Obelidium mucronatum]
MKPVHRILLSAVIAASILALLVLERPLARKEAPEPSLFKPYLVEHKPVNSTTGFSMPELLDFCHYGNDLHLSRSVVLGGDRAALEADYITTCFPIEISTSQAGRSMGHCSDFAQYIYHGQARLSLDFGRDTYQRKLKSCPNSIYLHGEYIVHDLLIPPTPPPSPPFDSVQSSHLREASAVLANQKPRNVWLPNLEQIHHNQLKFFQDMDAILCKTKITCTAVSKFLDSEEYSSYGGGHKNNKTLAKKPKVIFMSHSTPDPVEDVGKLLSAKELGALKQDFNGFFHAYGHSGRKRTIQLYDCWSANPKWPTLTMVGNSDEKGFIMRHWTPERRLKPPKHYTFPSNIKVHTRVSLAKLRKLQFSNGVHICPSQQEGYGHYINEARAVGALVVTTNWAPMNEFVENGNGVLIDHDEPQPEAYQGMAPYFVSPASASSKHICDGIARVLKLDLETRKKMGRKSREAYEKDNELLERMMKDLVAGKLL